MLLSIHPIPARSPAEREFVGMVGEDTGKSGEEMAMTLFTRKQGRERTWRGITRDWEQL